MLNFKNEVIMKKIYNQPEVTTVQFVAESQILAGSNITNIPTDNIEAD